MKTIGILFVITVSATFSVFASSITANLGYDGTNQLMVTKDAGLDNVVFTDVTNSAAGVNNGTIQDTRSGASTSFDNAFTPDFDGSRGYRGFLKGAGDLAAAIANKEYVQFALTLDSAEVVSLDSITISGLANSTASDTYRLYVSTTGFASLPAVGDSISAGTFVTAIGGDIADGANPLVTVGAVDFSLASSLVLGAGSTTYTFRLYIDDVPTGDAQGFEIDKIVFGVTAVASVSPQISLVVVR